MISDAGVKSQITFDDVYWGDDGRKNTHQIEGGYSNRTNDSGGPTNFAVTQATLDEYNHWKSSLKKGIICIFIFLSSNALHNTLFIPYVWLPIFFILILLKQKESR